MRTNQILIYCEYTLPTRYNYNGERAGVQALPMPFKEGIGPDLVRDKTLGVCDNTVGEICLKSRKITTTHAHKGPVNIYGNTGPGN